MMGFHAKSVDINQKEVAKWSAIFESLSPLKKRTIDIISNRYGAKVGRFLGNPSALSFLIEWDFTGSSLAFPPNLEDSKVDPNQLLREVSILEAYGDSDDIRSTFHDLK